VQNDHDDLPPNEDVIEEEDLDLDLADMSEAARAETLRERLQRAAERRSASGRQKNWHDTPVNVTPSGRHEIIEDDDALDDVNVDDMDVDGPDDTDNEVVVTPSGRYEVVDEEMDVNIGDLDESTLDASSYGSSDTDSFKHDDVRRDTERLEAPTPGPMTTAAMELDRSALAHAADAEPPEVVIAGASMPDDDGLGGSGPMTMAAMEMKSDTSQEEGLKVSSRKENPSGETGNWLLDNNLQRSAQADTGVADAAESTPAELESNSTGGDSESPEPSGTDGDGAMPGETDDNELDLGAEAGEQDRSEESDELDLSAGVPEDSAPGEDVAEDVADEAADESDASGEVSTGVVSEETSPAEPESYSQQLEESTVGDDSGAPLGRGLDVGTANLVAARMDEEGSIEFFPARNAFLDVPEDPYTLKMLKGQGVPYIKRENKLFIIGEDAFELANIFNREMRRPMKNGLISPTDVDAMPMEVELFKKILGPPRSEGEMVYYSVPADPVDSTMNIVYHTNIVNGLLERLGYRGTPFNEGQAIVFSELGDDDFTGIGISCGGGMVNICVAFRSMPVVSFSTSKGGDWIDQQAAQVMGCAASKITAVKERGVDINAPKTPEEEAIVIYYRHLIKYSLDNIIKKFEGTKDIPNFPKPVPIAVSGGTSKVGGFVEVFKDEFSKMASRFPIKISDIRRAEDQLNATSKGCLLAALSHED
jgi:hypothetical protein